LLQLQWGEREEATSVGVEGTEGGEERKKLED
jgi:hypothetical protein